MTVVLILTAIVLIILLSFHWNREEGDSTVAYGEPPNEWNSDPTPTPTPEPIQIPVPELTPTPTVTPEPTPEFDESGFLVISGFGRQRPKVSDFVHFSGIVIGKKYDSIKIIDFYGWKTGRSLAEPLLVLIGEGTLVTIHDSEALTGIRQGTRNDIALGAWVEVEGYYMEKDDTLDTNATRWDGKPGQIEIMQYNIKSPRE